MAREDMATFVRHVGAESSSLADRPPASGSATVENINNEEGPMATAHKPKYMINIEGVDFPWDEDTISVAQIRELGGLPADNPVIEVDLKDNTERTLGEDEIVEVKPGRGFGKKVKFQRG